MSKIFSLLIVLTVFVSTFVSLNAQSNSYWNDISSANVQSSGERVIIPERFRTLTLNTAEMSSVLFSAPQEKNVLAKNSNTIVSLPLPYGGFGRFRVVDSPVMEKGLADKFPEIRTFAGQGIDDPYASVRLDVTPHGFHAMIMTAGDMIFIDPYAKGDTYKLYFIF